VLVNAVKNEIPGHTHTNRAAKSLYFVGAGWSGALVYRALALVSLGLATQAVTLNFLAYAH
jgi:hypothetical protein